MKCENKMPKHWNERGFTVFCCDEHCEEYAEWINSKKSAKLSKSKEGVQYEMD